MLHRVFSVYDNKAVAFIRPFTAPTLGVTVRAFTEALSDPRHEFAKYPHDYVLYEIGEFDDQLGEIRAIQPRSHGLVSALVKSYAGVPSDETGTGSDEKRDDASVLKGSTG